MNKVIIDGRLTGDPIVSNKGDVSNTSFTVAVDTRTKGPDGSQQTNFYRATAWRRLGETCAKYLHKGDKVTIIGDLAMRTFTGRNGQQQTCLCVNIDNIEFQTPKRSAATTPADDDAQDPDETLPF